MTAAVTTNRRIILRSSDVIVAGKYEITGAVLMQTINPKLRSLWAFLSKGKAIQPVVYTEQQVIWIEETDLESIDV